MSPHHVCASGPTTVRDLIRGQVRPAEVLGAFPTAMYLRLAGGDVIALLTRDAVRLPLGLVLPTSSTEFPLSRLSGQVRVGSSLVRIGDWSFRLSRLVSSRAPTDLAPDTRAIAYARRRLRSFDLAELGPGLLDPDDQFADAASAIVGRLLGFGPGLTPSGDDVLAGFLVGSRTYGLVDGALTSAVLDAARTRTTDLSAALLRCACRGESIPQVSALLKALSGDGLHAGQLDQALVELIRVGHTSGLAMATGIVSAANAAIRRVHRHNNAAMPSVATAGECRQRAGSRH
jgi:hypothetical protein